MEWKSLRVAGVAVLALAVLLVLLLVRVPSSHRIVVRAYFTNALGLRAGAPVRLAGVDIGSVKSVRARPEMKEAPVEVLMVLTPSCELRIPNDAIASLTTAGVLGETYVDIDVARASGAPIGPDAVIKTVVTPQISTQELIEKFGEVLSRRCDCDSGKRDDAANTTVKKDVSKSRSQPR
jgi:phospholipid/cholesterol/gamma-HCH transport system substrate-binding protein